MSSNHLRHAPDWLGTVVRDRVINLRAPAPKPPKPPKPPRLPKPKSENPQRRGPKIKSVIGHEFGHRTVIEEPVGHHPRRVLVRCRCGRIDDVQLSSLHADSRCGTCARKMMWAQKRAEAAR